MWGIQLYFFASGVSSAPPMDMAQQLLNNPVVANAALQYGQGIMNVGQRYIDQEVRERGGSCTIVNNLLWCSQAASRLAGLKRYFAVDTSYVMKKLFLLVFPYTHRVRIIAAALYTHITENLGTRLMWFMHQMLPSHTSQPVYFTHCHHPHL